MKMLDALVLGEEYGLETVLEAIENVEVHCCNLFQYSEIEHEIEEMRADISEFRKRGIYLKMPIVDAIELMKS